MSIFSKKIPLVVKGNGQIDLWFVYYLKQYYLINVMHVCFHDTGLDIMCVFPGSLIASSKAYQRCSGVAFRNQHIFGLTAEI